MNLEVVRAPACLVVDTNAKIASRLLLDALANRNYQGVIRYVPLPGVNPAGDIDEGELALILSHPAKFLSWFVQHPRFPGWKPREHDAEADARWAARFAHEAGYPPGVHGFVDAEGMSADTTAAEAHFYNSLWCHVMVEEGFAAGLYDGYSQPETPEELYGIPQATSYWSDAAHRRVAVRGTAVVQGPEFTLLGTGFDPDVVAPDLKGETPFCVRAA
jgi:hypothetical protein